MRKSLFLNFSKYFITVILLLLGCSESRGEIEKFWTKAKIEEGQAEFSHFAELSLAEELFSGLFLNNKTLDQNIKLKWARLGMDMLSLTTRTAEYIILAEAKRAQFGRGFYVIRKPVSKQHYPIPILIQAPHAFSDTGTGELALKLFQETRALALSLNTINRIELDLAHESDTFFQTFTKAFVVQVKSGIVLQLHGFGSKKRKTKAARSAKIIVSSGSTSATNYATKVFLALQKRFGNEVKLYAKQVEELGGITNTQGKLVRESGTNVEFLHLEMNEEFRKELIANKSARKSFFTAIEEVQSL